MCRVGGSSRGGIVAWGGSWRSRRVGWGVSPQTAPVHPPRNVPSLGVVQGAGPRGYVKKFFTGRDVVMNF